jgi:hypothetical protein
VIFFFCLFSSALLISLNFPPVYGVSFFFGGGGQLPFVSLIQISTCLLYFVSALGSPNA